MTAENATAEMLRLRTELASNLKALVIERGLTQKRAAELFGVVQPRVSSLMNDKIEQFGLDTLAAMTLRAGLKIKIRVT